MFGISFEHLLIMGGILVIFGPRKLPEVGVTLGKAVRNFKEHFNGIQEPEFRRLTDQSSGADEQPRANSSEVDHAS